MASPGASATRTVPKRAALWGSWWESTEQSPETWGCPSWQHNRTSPDRGTDQTSYQFQRPFCWFSYFPGRLGGRLQARTVWLSSSIFSLSPRAVSSCCPYIVGSLMLSHQVFFVSSLFKNFKSDTGVQYLLAGRVGFLFESDNVTHATNSCPDAEPPLWLRTQVLAKWPSLTKQTRALPLDPRCLEPGTQF